MAHSAIMDTKLYTTLTNLIQYVLKAYPELITGQKIFLVELYQVRASLIDSNAPVVK